MTQDRKNKLFKIISKHNGVTIKQLEKEFDISEGPIRKLLKDLKDEGRISVVKRNKSKVYYTVDENLKEQFIDMIKKMNCNMDEIKEKFYSSEYDIQHYLIYTLEEFDRLNQNKKIYWKDLEYELDNEHDAKEYTDLCRKIFHKLKPHTKIIIYNKLHSLLDDANKFYSKVINARNFIRASRNNKTSIIRKNLTECVEKLDVDSGKLMQSTYDIFSILEKIQYMPKMPEDISYFLSSLEKSVKRFDDITTNLLNNILTYQQESKVKPDIRKKTQKCIKKISDMKKDSKNVGIYLFDVHKSIFLSEIEQELLDKITDTENILKEIQVSCHETISKIEKIWPKTSLKSFTEHCK